MSSGRTWSFQKSCGRSAWSCSQPGEREREGRVKHFCLRVGGTWSAGGQGETQRRRDSPVATGELPCPARRDCTRCALCWCSFCALIPAASCSAPGRRSGSPTAGGGNDSANRHIDWSPRVWDLNSGREIGALTFTSVGEERVKFFCKQREKYVLECSMSFFPFTYSSLKYRPREGGKKQQAKDTFHYNLLLLDLHTRLRWEGGSPHPPHWSCVVVPLWLSVEASLEALPGKDKRKEQFWKTGPLWCCERPVKCLLVVAIVCLLFVTSTACCLFIGHRCVGKQRCVHELYTISTLIIIRRVSLQGETPGARLMRTATGLDLFEWRKLFAFFCQVFTSILWTVFLFVNAFFCGRSRKFPIAGN